MNERKTRLPSSFTAAPSMVNLLGGLMMLILGFAIHQFSSMFGLYSANPKDENGVPWPYLLLRAVAISLMLSGIILMIIGLQ